jgi:hypothetical protein
VMNHYYAAVRRGSAHAGARDQGRAARG